jgi:hypothetical protein
MPGIINPGDANTLHTRAGIYDVDTLDKHCACADVNIVIAIRHPIESRHLNLSISKQRGPVLFLYLDHNALSFHYQGCGQHAHRTGQRHIPRVDAGVAPVHHARD